MKIFVASFSRSSDGALTKLIRRMKEEDIWTDDYAKADYILAPGDRIETLHFVIDRYNENKPIIHLWAGEKTQGCHDELWRRFITEMSMMQLCTNDTALNNLTDKRNAHVVGNIMLDNLDVDESKIPSFGDYNDQDYDIVLYNPPTLLSQDEIRKELESVFDLLHGKYIWIEPNGDHGSDLVLPYVNCKTLPRGQYLGLLKNCHRFITNSSSSCYEAMFLIRPDRIIQVGVRNSDRESKHAKMDIPGATEKVISLLKKMK